jgi:hypothetical protein
VHSAQCTVHSAQCTVHSAQCTVHSAQCTVHSAQCSDWRAHGQEPVGCLELSFHQSYQLLAAAHAGTDYKGLGVDGTAELYRLHGAKQMKVNCRLFSLGPALGW